MNVSNDIITKPRKFVKLYKFVHTLKYSQIDVYHKITKSKDPKLIQMVKFKVVRNKYVKYVDLKPLIENIGKTLYK